MIANHVHSQLEIRRIEKNTMIVREIYIYIYIYDRKYQKKLD